MVFQARVPGSNPGQELSLPLSFILLGADTAWQAISQGGKAWMQVTFVFVVSVESMGFWVAHLHCGRSLAAAQLV